MKLRFIKKIPESQDVYTFIFKPGKKLTWLPGQYLHYELPHAPADARGATRWFTISSPPYTHCPSITTRFHPRGGSTFKQALLRLAAGAEIETGLPRGEFILDTDAARQVMIAGGLGITPFHSQIAQLAHDGKPLNIDLLYANRDDDLVFGGQFQVLAAKHPEFKLSKFIGERTIQAADLAPLVKDPRNIFYISGSEAMVQSYQRLLEELDVAPENVRTDYSRTY